MSLMIPLVGMHFRPPAREILSALPVGSSLTLVPEPTNPYDPNAVQVFYDMTDFPVDRIELLNTILPNDAPDASSLCAAGMFHLGYLSATGKKTSRGGPGNAEALLLMSQPGEIIATLGLAIEGHPVVNLVLKDH